MSFQGLSDAQKVAIIVAQLPLDLQDQLLSKFSESEVVRVMSELAALPAISPETVDEIGQELIRSFGTLHQAKQGGLDVAEDLLRRRLGDRRAAELIDQLREAAPAEAPLDFINRVDPQQIHGVCANENPQAVAIVLAHIDPAIAADVLKRLEDAARTELTMRIAKLGPIPTSVVKRLANVLESRLSTFVRAGNASTTIDGVSSAVHILSNTDRSSEKQIIGQLEEIDPELAERIRSEMFGWEDVLELDDRTLQIVLREITMPGLAKALKNKSSEVVETFKRNLGERQLEDLEEEIGALDKIRLSEVEAEESVIVKTVRRLNDAGEIDIVRGENEILV